MNNKAFSNKLASYNHCQHYNHYILNFLALA